MANEQELLQQISELKEKISSLNIQLKQQSFGLNWIDVPEAFEKESIEKIPILEEVKDKSITTDETAPTHILIEGDNFHALTCLNYTHRGKIDVIYIDPPYNTGSDGFTYRDKRYLEEYPDGTIIPKNHPLRHSAWLSFMEKRLSLARPLLKDDGVIFISINEDEYAQLKLLCDKIFLPENYITTFTIKVRHEDRILKGDKPIHETTEFLLFYQKTSKFKIRKRIKDTSDPSLYEFQIKELISDPEEIELGGKVVKVFRPGQYEINKVDPDFSNLKKINIRGSIKTGNSSGRFHMNYLEERRDEFNVLYKVPDIGEDGLGYRYFISRKDERQANGSYFQGAPIDRQDTAEIPYPNYVDMEEVFNSVGTEGGVPFDGGKKPIEFLQHFLNIARPERSNICVLDFFGGSGSTGHAIIDRNFKGSYSQAILVQLPETTYEIKKGARVAKANCKTAFNAGYNTITDITYRRFYNVINGYTDEKQKQHPGLGNNLKYYKTSFVGSNDVHSATDDDKAELASKAGGLLALIENTLYNVECNSYYSIYQDNKGRYTAIYSMEDYSKFDCFIKDVKSLVGKVIVYVFCWTNADEFKQEFEDSCVIDVKPIPQPILDIYISLNAL